MWLAHNYYSMMHGRSRIFGKLERLLWTSLNWQGEQRQILSFLDFFLHYNNATYSNFYSAQHCMSKHLLLVTFQLLTMSNSFSNLIKTNHGIMVGSMKILSSQRYSFIKIFLLHPNWQHNSSSSCPGQARPVSCRPLPRFAIHCQQSHCLTCRQEPLDQRLQHGQRRALTTGSASKILLGS